MFCGGCFRCLKPFTGYLVMCKYTELAPYKIGLKMLPDMSEDNANIFPDTLRTIKM